MSLQRKYPQLCALLEQIAGRPFFVETWNRLEDIHETTEQLWWRNFEMMRRWPVRYLFIGEAAPWSETGSECSYFYNSAAPSVRLMTSIYTGLKPELRFSTRDYRERLQQLRESGFLLIDSLPFPFRYTGQMRSKASYTEFVGQCCKDYLIPKITDASITWSANICVMFGYKKNAEAIAASFPGGIELPGINRAIQVNSKERIVASPAGWPTSALIAEACIRHI